MSEGHTKDLLAQTDLMTMHLHCYGPKGGENGLHAHIDEDHVFVVLQGEAQFRGADGMLPVLRKNQALMLPKGSFYSFSNESTEPLVLLRFGASAKDAAGGRLDPDGKPIPGRGKLLQHRLQGTAGERRRKQLFEARRPRRGRQSQPKCSSIVIATEGRSG